MSNTRDLASPHAARKVSTDLHPVNHLRDGECEYDTAQSRAALLVRVVTLEAENATLTTALAEAKAAHVELQKENAKYQVVARSGEIELAGAKAGRVEAQAELATLRKQVADVESRWRPRDCSSTGFWWILTKPQNACDVVLLAFAISSAMMAVHLIVGH